MDDATERAHLGLATTQDLLQELEVRAHVGALAGTRYRDELRELELAARRFQDKLPAAVLDYRTVDREGQQP